MSNNVITVEVTGLKELREALLKLPKELQGRPLRSATSAAAKVVQEQAIANAPEDTGRLKKSIYRTRSRSGSSAVQETAIVGVRAGAVRKYANTRFNVRKGKVGKSYQESGEAFYWRFFEFGTVKMSARPFLRPAFENTKKAQLDAMAQRLSRSIAFITNKLNKGSKK